MRRSRPKAQSLQQAASTIFVLMGLLPFLIFVYLVVMLNGMQNWRVQLGLGIALAFALLGFSVLVSTMRRTSLVLKLLMRTESPRAPAPLSLPPSSEAPPVADGAARPATMTATGARGKAVAHAKKAGAVEISPALGAIKELQDATAMVGRRWREEAERLKGRAVRVAVVDFDEPEAGMLIRTSEDGLVLDQSGQELGILWRFVSSIELYATSDELAQAGT